MLASYGHGKAHKRVQVRAYQVLTRLDIKHDCWSWETGQHGLERGAMPPQTLEGRRSSTTKQACHRQCTQVAVLHTRALICCCAVARAQHLGQHNTITVLRNSRSRGWLRAAQHAILGAQQFLPQKIGCMIFSPQAEKKNGGLSF